jgi:hypothetical protein
MNERLVRWGNFCQVKRDGDLWSPTLATERSRKDGAPSSRLGEIMFAKARVRDLCSATPLCWGDLRVGHPRSPKVVRGP